MSAYVLGFAFDLDHHVALIRKSKPEWQAGKLNGIGGKIEPTDPNPMAAMIREFYEETGCSSSLFSWNLFAVMWFGDSVIHCYYTDRDLGDLRTTTDEEVGVYDTRSLRSLPVLPNLHWLIPLAMTREGQIAGVSYPNNTSLVKVAT